MLDRLQALADRYEKLSELLCDPDVASDPKRLREYSKEQSDLQEAYEAIRNTSKSLEQLDERKAMLGEKLDDEMREMVKMEIEELTERRQSWRSRFAFCCCRKTRTTTRTSSWRSAARPAATKRPCSLPICTGCTRAMPIRQGWRVEVLDVQRERSRRL